jgi:myo-inositol-1-phosphate synthase
MKVWIVGIKGAVATTAIIGTLAICRGISSNIGVSTEGDYFKECNLARLDELEFGGHDIRSISLYDAAYQNVRDNNTFSVYQLSELKDDLDIIPVKCGILNNCGSAISSLCESRQLTLREAQEQVSNELNDFANGDDCIVVNLASTEPFFPPHDEYSTLDKFENAIRNNSKKIPASSIYAYCAIKNGMPYINFTPSLGNDVPAIKELAEKERVPHCGKDGKTGETLVKTALVPMFKLRNLVIEGWYGSNILGNLDGHILNNPDNKQSKLITKTSVVPKMLGYEPHLGSRIDYFPPLIDHKVAWDFIAFRGFLNHRMNMQFTWQGCDSILAAPLVIDLIRLMELAKRTGTVGVVKKLAVYFKDPIDMDVLDLCTQHEIFKKWIEHVKMM